MWKSYRSFLNCALFATLLCWPWVSAEALNSTRSDSARVHQLIEQLGANSFHRRRQAANELRHLGLRAIDELLEAAYSDDPEIRLATRRLAAQMLSNWTRPGDHQIVKYALNDFATQDPGERTRRAFWLAELEDGVGTDGVLRIVRFDRSDIVAKQAAIRFIEVFDPEVKRQRDQLSKALKETIEDAERLPAKWLRAFQHSIQGKDQPDAWKGLLEAEMALEGELRSSPQILAQLLRWNIEQAFKYERDEAAHEFLGQLVTLQRDDPEALLESCHWLLDDGHGKLLDQFVFEPHQKLIETDPFFRYCQAEVKLAAKDQEAAEELAAAAFALTEAEENIGDEVEAQTKQQFADPINQIWARYRLSRTLEERGLTEWAIREYQRVAETETPQWNASRIKERTIRGYAELLHDRQRDKEAADVLGQLVNSDEEALKFAQREFNSDWAGVISRMHFFRSEQHRLEANREGQIEELLKGIKADPTDADVLIAMYRLPRADEAWKTDTQQKIQHAVGVFEGRLEGLRAVGVAPNRFEIATELNQIAWLVGNTEGDFAKAVEQSRQSLELRPQSAGSLDTLGRTYFAVGDLENAIKFQRRAHKLDPNSQQIERQLHEFEVFRSQLNQQP